MKKLFLIFDQCRVGLRFNEDLNITKNVRFCNAGSEEASPSRNLFRCKPENLLFISNTSVL